MPSRAPLRLWPGVVAALLVILLKWVVPRVAPDASIVGWFGGAGGAALILLWWLFFSRAAWSERLGGVALIVVGLMLTPRFLHFSIAEAGQGIVFYFNAAPILALAFVAWAVTTYRMSDGVRRLTMVVTILVACGGWLLLRTPGVTGEMGSVYRWRWSETPEEKLLAAGDDATATAASTAIAAESEPEWPGFRGRNRDGVVSGVRIATDWSTSPPVELWRRPVGPGWSSFAVHGGRIYTQEQRGEDEIVSCYDAMTGEPVWRHRDPARFWESNAGAGPRGTPTLSGGRVYTLGATGIVNALDATDGSLLWSRNAVNDSGTPIPYWGIAGSPLVVDDVLIVSVSVRLVAYDAATGELRWSGPERTGEAYSSPHRVMLEGIDQVLLPDGGGVTSVDPADGTLLWRHAWQGAGIVQPSLTVDGDVLVGATAMAGGAATRRVSVAHGPDGWTTEERWTSSGLKPYFNDFVVHEGHAYGFDNSILACIDLEDGERKWKRGRYGSGQLVLLPDQDLLLVTSESGELVLVAAKPNGFAELARFEAIEGKTWNHPVLVGDTVFIRNDREMAAFRLVLAGRGRSAADGSAG